MTLFSKYLLPSMLAASLFLSPWSPFSQSAAAKDPVVVVSVAGADEVVGDIAYLTEATGFGDIGRLIALMAGPYTAQLDKSKPSGSYIHFDEDDRPIVVGFIPVKNLDALLATLVDQVGEPEDAGDGIVEIGTDNPQSMFIKETDGWAFLSNKKAHLKDVPKNPAKLLGKLPEQYTLAVRVNAKEIPEDAKKLVIQQLREGFAEGAAAELAGDAAADQLARKLGRSWLDSMTRVINETEEVTLGWEIDAAGQTTYLDITCTAVAESKLAEQMALLKHSTSKFAGFLLEDAAVTAHVNAESSAEEIEQVQYVIQTIRDQAMKSIEDDDDLENDEERKTAKAIINQLIDVAEQSIKAGKMDGGAVLVLKPDALTVAAGGFVADGSKLEDALKQLVHFAQTKDRKLAEAEFTSIEHRGVTIHSTTIPLDTSKEEAKQLLGERLEVSCGIGKHSAYGAFGKGAAELLKRVIDKSEENANEKLPPAQLTISMAPIVDCISQFDDNPALFLVRESLKEAAKNDKDELKLVVFPVKRGVTYRIEFQEGVLQALGEAGKMIAPMFQGGL